MKQIPAVVGQMVRLLLFVACVAPAYGGTLRCAPDSAKVGDACIGRYEGSVWQIPPSNTALVKKVLSGRATLADLTSGGDARS